MAACEITDIFNASARLAENYSEKHLQAMSVYLLGVAAKTLDPMIDTSPGGLLRASRCYMNCMSGKALEAAMVYLLCQLNGQAGVGAIQVLHGNGDPNVLGVVPVEPGLAAVYIDDDQVLPNFNWSVPGQQWY